MHGPPHVPWLRHCCGVACGLVWPGWLAQLLPFAASFLHTTGALLRPAGGSGAGRGGAHMLRQPQSFRSIEVDTYILPLTPTAYTLLSYPWEQEQQLVTTCKWRANMRGGPGEMRELGVGAVFDSE